MGRSKGGVESPQNPRNTSARWPIGRARFWAELSELVPAAIRCIVRALRSENESTGLRAAVGVLERDARFNKTQQVAVAHLIPSEQLERARRLAGELKELQVTPLT